MRTILMVIKAIFVEALKGTQTFVDLLVMFALFSQRPKRWFICKAQWLMNCYSFIQLVCNVAWPCNVA